MTLSELTHRGAFRPYSRKQAQASDSELDGLLDGGEVDAFLRLAVRTRKTIVLAGGTSSGKTTLLNALVKEIDPAE